MKLTNIKILKTFAFAVLLPFQAQANVIKLPPGSSIDIGGTTVQCEGRAREKQLFKCLCHNTGRTDNPAPVWIYVRSTDLTTVNNDGRRACSDRNYGNPDFGFSPVSQCYMVPQ